MNIQKLFHYTSGNGLLGIVKEYSIWATNIHFQNDSKEYIYARDLLKSKIRLSHNRIIIQFKEELLTILDAISNTSVYVICLSEDSDSLGQWRGYCLAGAGYSIGFNGEKLESCAKKQGFVLRKCIYNLNEQKEILEKLISDVCDDLEKKYKGEKDDAFIKNNCGNLIKLFT